MKPIFQGIDGNRQSIFHSSSIFLWMIYIEVEPLERMMVYIFYFYLMLFSYSLLHFHPNQLQGNLIFLEYDFQSY